MIQEVVDEHKDEMPTGVVTRVMAECQKAYEAAPKLYKLTWTVVDSHAHIEYCEDEDDLEADFAAVKLSHQTQTLIVEAVNLSDVPSSQRCLTVLPLHGKMFKSWLKLAMPYGKSKDGCPGSMCIIHSIVPYEPRKRARDAEMAQNEREVRELVGGA